MSACEPGCNHSSHSNNTSVAFDLGLVDCVWDCPNCGRPMRALRHPSIAGELTPCKKCVEAAFAEMRARKALGVKTPNPDLRG